MTKEYNLEALKVIDESNDFDDSYIIQIPKDMEFEEMQYKLRIISKK